MPYVKIINDDYTIVYKEEILTEIEKKDYKYFNEIPQIEKKNGFKYRLRYDKDKNLYWQEIQLPPEKEISITELEQQSLKIEEEKGTDE